MAGRVNGYEPDDLIGLAGLALIAVVTMITAWITARRVGVVHAQVKNGHTRNLRDDLDDVRDTLQAITADLSEVRRDLRGVLQDISIVHEELYEERWTRCELEHRLGRAVRRKCGSKHPKR